MTSPLGGARSIQLSYRGPAASLPAWRGSCTSPCARSNGTQPACVTAMNCCVWKSVSPKVRSMSVRRLK